MKRKLLLLVFMTLLSKVLLAQMPKYQLSTHILDITLGQPASEVKISLARQQKNGSWKTIDEKVTDENGRIKNFLAQEGKDNTGIYKLTFHVSPYFEKNKQTSFYPYIEVVFQLKDNEHYHVPITLSLFGYATYRGS